MGNNYPSLISFTLFLFKRLESTRLYVSINFLFNYRPIGK